MFVTSRPGRGLGHKSIGPSRSLVDTINRNSGVFLSVVFLGIRNHVGPFRRRPIEELETLVRRRLDERKPTEVTFGFEMEIEMKKSEVDKIVT